MTNQYYHLLMHHEALLSLCICLLLQQGVKCALYFLQPYMNIIEGSLSSGSLASQGACHP